ncbi:DNA primase [Salmonella enterica]|nr:DNA primase [Salmonella enterica]EAY5245260.1 DNA primase [Salmonella enterica]
MKNAPNLKHLPKDKFIEAIIFAGVDAYAHVQHWIESEGKKHGDNVPPVYLGKKQLADLANIRIIDKGRRYARVYQAGDIEPIQINAIAEKMALAGVQDAKLYKGIPDRNPEDWRDYLQRIREQAERGETLVDEYNKSQEKRQIATGLDLAQMAASQRAKILAEYYGKIAVIPESGAVYVFNGAIWEKVTDNDLRRTMGTIFDENDTPYSPKGIDAAIDAMKIQIPVMGEPSRDLIGFANGVYDLTSQTFSPHCADNWLMNHNGITYIPPVQGESIATHAPYFTRWLNHATGGDSQKGERIKAALFMVLAKRHDWQLFIEVTGEGGSGKSVFSNIATMLAGEHNTASGSMSTLDLARGRAQFVGKSLIIIPDQTRYVGEGSGIKAITGGDPVEIDGKYEKQFTTVLSAVVIATNNEPMTFTERNGGIARRRVIFPFNVQVKDTEKDPQLPEKIRGEIPVIIRHLLNEFSDPNRAKALLLEQRQSLDALNVKRGTDPVIDMCAALHFMSEPKGMMMGGGTWAGQPEPRKYLYHLYLAFLEYHGLGKPLSVEKFSRAMNNAAKEYREVYKTRKINGRAQTNVGLNEEAEEFLPRAFGLEIPDNDTPL